MSSPWMPGDPSLCLPPAARCSGRCIHIARENNVPGSEGLGWHCGDYSEEFDFYCTLPKGHPGDHVACGPGGHDLASWPNSKGVPPKPKEGLLKYAAQK